MAARFGDFARGRVVSTKRVGASMYGNPTYDVTLDDGRTYRTSIDSGLAYGITNPEYRNVSHDFELTSAGRLSGYVRVSE